MRIYCHECKKKSCITHKQEKNNELLTCHLNRNSYRILGNIKKISRNTAYAVVNRTMKELIHSNELTLLLQPQNYSGIILVDGKYFPVKGRLRGCVVIPFIDYLTHDIPIHIFAHTENTVDVREGFEKLKAIGYQLKVVVCDESMGEIATVAKEVFPEVIIQTCLTHYMKNIDREFKVKEAKRRIQSLKKELRYMGESVLVPSHVHDIEKAKRLTNEIANLEFEYGYLIEVQSIFQHIFWGVHTEEELDKAEYDLNYAISKMNLKTYPYAERIRRRYLDYYEKREQILAFLKFPEMDIPKTTNLIEGFNSTTLEARLSTIRGFEKEENAESYLNALILKRRFQKFTDCKKKFKHLNGKSPLQISKPLNDFGFDFNSNDWINFCRNLEKWSQR